MSTECFEAEWFCAVCGVADHVLCPASTVLSVCLDIRYFLFLHLMPNALLINHLPSQPFS